MENSENSHIPEQLIENPPMLSAALYQKGKSLYKQGKLKDSLNSFQEAAKLLSDQPKDLIETNLRISEIFVDEDQVDSSAEILDRSLEICHANFEEDDPLVAKVYNYLSKTNRVKRKFEIAYKQSLKAFEINTKKLDPNDIEMGRSYHSLGSCLKFLVRYDEAKLALEKALEIKEMYTGEDRDVELGLTYQTLGNLYHATGEYNQTTECLKTSLNLMQAYYNCNHPDINYATESLGRFYLHIGKLKKAQTCYESLLKSSLALHGDTNDTTARAYKGLGGLYHKLGHYSAAEDNLIRALNIFKTLFGEDYSSAASTCVTIAEVKFNQEKFIEAIKYTFQALQVYEKTLGSRETFTQKAMTNLSDFLTGLSILEYAKNPGLKALLLRRKFYGTGHYYYTNKRRGIDSIQSRIESNQPFSDQFI